MNDNFLNTIKEVYLKTFNAGFITSECYDLLVQKGEIEKDDYLESDVIDMTLKRMHNEASKKGPLALKELASVRNAASFEKTMDTECKKQVVANYFTLQYNLDNF